MTDPTFLSAGEMAGQIRACKISALELVDAHLAKINEYVEAGYDHVYVHQIGPDQDGFFRFYQREIMPRLELEPAQAQPQAARA